MYKKILVANDGSDDAKRALGVAVELAKRYDAELHSISIEENLPRYLATINEVEETAREADTFFAQVAEAAQAVAKRAGVKLFTHVIAGHEVEAIVTFTKDNAFDLLVVGFMGHSRAFDRIWGGTSQNLTRLASCSVLIVK